MLLERVFFSGARVRVLALFGLLHGVALSQPGSVRGATFTVTPIQVFLSAKNPSALLTLRNESKEALRFQFSLFAWDQSPKGEILLTPTDDIVFFPTLVTLAPGEERRVRVGATVPVASSEKSYRIFVEELPPLKKSDGPEPGGQVQLLTKMGIPIFLQPDRRIVEGRVQGMSVRKGALSFQVKNTGNVHFVAEQIRVKGYAPAGDTIFERQLEGWYILSGRLQTYELELPKNECFGIGALAVEVQGAQKAFKERLEMPPRACSE